MRTAPHSLQNWSLRSSARAAALLAPILALAACAPDLCPLPQPADVQSLATQKSFAAPEAPWPQAAWWKAYGDAQLDGLMDEALAGSPDLKIAEARMREADAMAKVSGASFWPSLTGNASADETRESLN